MDKGTCIKLWSISSMINVQGLLKMSIRAAGSTIEAPWMLATMTGSIKTILAIVQNIRDPMLKFWI